MHVERSSPSAVAKPARVSRRERRVMRLCARSCARESRRVTSPVSMRVLDTSRATPV
jgi:hypothetical protein